MIFIKEREKRKRERERERESSQREREENQKPGRRVMARRLPPGLASRRPRPLSLCQDALVKVGRGSHSLVGHARASTSSSSETKSLPLLDKGCSDVSAMIYRRESTLVRALSQNVALKKVDTRGAFLFGLNDNYRLLRTSRQLFCTRAVEKDNAKAMAETQSGDGPYSSSSSPPPTPSSSSSSSASDSEACTVFKDEILTEDDQAAQERITWLGLVSNVGLSVSKGIIGAQSGSHALVADAFHSASDLAGDIVALAALNFAKKPADDKHPYGYGHYESLATLTMAVLLVGGGTGIGYHSFAQLTRLASTLDSAALPVETVTMIPQAIGIITFSVLVKEWLYRVTVKIGNETKSPVLVANAWHHRSDAFSSIVSLLGVAGAGLGAPYLDPVAGLLVSGMVLKAGANVGWEAVQDLTDRTRDSDKEVVRGVYAIAKSLADSPGSGIEDVHQVRVRRLGHYQLLDFHMRVDPRLSVTGGYFENNRIKRRIYAAFPRVSEIFVHVQAHSSRSNNNKSSKQLYGKSSTSSSEYAIERSLSFRSTKELRDKASTTTTSSRLERLNAQRSALVSHSVRSALSIQGDVAECVAQCEAIDPVILGLEHANVHYDLDSVLENQDRGGNSHHPVITVEVNLRMDKTVTLRRAEQAAKVVRDKIVAIPDVDHVDLHVELLD